MRFIVLLFAAIALCGCAKSGPSSPAVSAAPSTPISGSSTRPTTRPSADYAALAGVWIHKRTDHPGPQEPTYYILHLSPDGHWAWMALWGTPEKPVKSTAYAQGSGAHLLPLNAAWGRTGEITPPLLPSPDSHLMLPRKDGSFLSLGAVARKDADTLVFHNFDSIYWTNEYKRASPRLQQSLNALLQHAPAATRPAS